VRRNPDTIAVSLTFALILFVSHSVSPEDPKPRTVCPSGSFAMKEQSQWYCYKFYEELFTFQEAEEECQFKCKGHLASFMSDNQAKYINAYVSKENLENKWVWIGLQRVSTSNLVSTRSSCL
ncbi:lithostathine-1-beta-like, partial [Pseudonaja textilis]|uniref:lithostathine-1-beta-like n=1 Tax=Pseudonaja textilis TaxID=8673 RepID=UPI000EA913B0